MQHFQWSDRVRFETPETTVVPAGLPGLADLRIGCRVKNKRPLKHSYTTARRIPVLTALCVFRLFVCLFGGGSCFLCTWFLCEHFAKVASLDFQVLYI